MCDLPHTGLKSSQDVWEVSETLAVTPLKKFRFSPTPEGRSPFRLPLLPLLPSPPAVSQKLLTARRKKLWELDPYYHCSVIGTCLTLPELRQIQRRLGGGDTTSISDYDLHRAFVVAIREVTPASRLIHKHLDRKYRVAIQQIGKVSSTEAWVACWEAALRAGDIASAYWALITQPDVPGWVLERVYGDVHMLLHLSGAAIRVVTS